MDRFTSQAARAELFDAVSTYLAHRTKPTRLEKIASRVTGFPWLELSQADKRVPRCGWTRWSGDGAKWTRVSP